MEKRLKNLKKAMTQTVYKDVVFSDKQRKKILLEIRNQQNPELDILQLLQTARTGYELSQALLARGVENYSANEGMLYVSLHELEEKGYIESKWMEAQKYYQLSQSGNKWVVSQEKGPKASILKEITEGGI